MEDSQKDISQQITQPVDTEGITNGPILILLVVLLIAILGGMYRWFVILNNDVPTINAGLRPTAAENNEPESTTAEARVEAMGIVSSSDEIPAIEADIESTDLDSMESELDAIEAELDAALQEEPTTEPASPAQP
jgi:hypothetical protein